MKLTDFLKRCSLIDDSFMIFMGFMMKERASMTFQ